MSDSPKSPSLADINKQDFVKHYSVPSTTPQLVSKNLALVDQIKLTILNFSDDIISHIAHWSNISFLNRIIVIFRDELTAENIYKFISDKLKIIPYLKVTLQENLLTRSKSFDNMAENDSLNVVKSLNNFKNFYNDPKNDLNDYIEPEPAKFNVLQDLSKLGIDVSQYNDAEQMQELRDEQDGRVSPVKLTRKKSTTKTLFRPDLKVDVSQPKTNTEEFPASPSITLDETF
ncbi:hypothetical protein SBY92_002773 [Candida maltosa Xu316]